MLGDVGNGPLPVQIPDLSMANENVIGERRKQNSPSGRKVRPATGPMLGTPNKSNGVLTSDKSTKAMAGQSSEPKAEIEKDATTPEHSTHSTPEGKIANATLGVTLSSEIVEKGVVKKVRDEQDDVENNQEGFSDRNGRDDETPPPAKRACI